MEGCRWKLLLSFLAITAAVWASDPLIGTWKVNPEKSDYERQHPRKSRITMKYEVLGDRWKWRTDGVSGGDGTEWYAEVIFDFDGKDYPIRGTFPGSTLAAKRVDTHTVQETYRVEGKVVSTATRLISQGGTIMSATTQGVDAKGRPFRNVLIFEKE